MQLFLQPPANGPEHVDVGKPVERSEQPLEQHLVVASHAELQAEIAQPRFEVMGTLRHEHAAKSPEAAPDSATCNPEIVDGVWRIQADAEVRIEQRGRLRRQIRLDHFASAAAVVQFLRSRRKFRPSIDVVAE